MLYTACKDYQAADTVLVFCQHPAWQAAHFTSEELAKLLLYYYTVTREEDRHRGLTVIVDARGTTLPTLNMLLETLYTVEANQPGTVNITHVLADKVAQSLLFRSSVFRPQVKLRIDLVNNIETLFKFIPRHGLTPQLGGTFHPKHPSWCKFRMTLEPFLHRCRRAASVLLAAMDNLTSATPEPATPTDATRLLATTQRCLDDALGGAGGTSTGIVAEVREDGGDVIEQMRKMKEDLFSNDDYRCSLDTAENLYGQLDHTVRKLSQLAQERLQQLKGWRRVRLHEDRCKEFLTWISTEGEEILMQFDKISDNLKGIRVQQKAFEKVYFTAMSQLEKANDLLEEAKSIKSLDGSTATCSQGSGVKDISSDLRGHMNRYGQKLEDMREKIDDTSQCYHLLDKSYEWALGAMKHGASIKIDKHATAESLDQVLRSLDVYLDEHPPVTPETFATMLSIAKKLDNDKLYQQCEIAQSRCQETQQMLEDRALRLKQARLRITSSEDCVDNHNVSFSAEEGGVVTPTRQLAGPFAPRDVYMSQLMSVLRRHSYAGKPSAPQYSPCVAAFKDRDMNLWEYEEYLFNEGLITEDMSDRVVTSLPKGLSDSTLRGSRESLRGSVENLVPESPVTAGVQGGDSLARNLSASILEDLRAAGSIPASLPGHGRHRPPHRKMLKKASSCVSAPEGSSLMGSDVLPSIRERRSNKSISMITGSNESLPSMPEEEEVDSSHPAERGSAGEAPSSPAPITTERKFGWSPVPVNTHLLQQQGVRMAPAHNSRPGLTHSQSMADLRVTEEEHKRRKTLSHIIHEMILTERDYVRSLQFVIEHYLPELSRDDLPQSLRGKRNVIFGNIEKIYEFHNTRFLSALEKYQNNPLQVSRCFLDHDQEFFLYALYNKNKPKSDTLMAEYGVKFFKHKQVELGDRLDLSSYLLKPVQRIAKYSLLLRQLLKTCPSETDPEYNDLMAAAEMVRFQIRHGNDLLAMDALKACDVNLQEQGMLLRQDEFLVYQGKKKCFRHVFLFEEMVLFSKTKRTSSGSDVYIYKNSIKTSDLGLTETVSDYPHKFEIWFRKRTAGDTYVLQAAMMDVKHAWVKEISMLLWKQAFRNRERRLSEAARMGIGRKPCMDLKPSKDNIQDRFINVSIGNQIPRMRNSIAVSSFDHLRNGSKRPHSLISVSSSSSSSSGASSQSATSSAIASTTMTHTATEMPSTGIQAVAPPMPKFYSLCSTESGIEVDLNTSVMEDACTQTTLKRPQNRSRKAAASSAISCDEATTMTANREPGDGTDVVQVDDSGISLSTMEHTLCTDV